MKNVLFVVVVWLVAVGLMHAQEYQVRAVRESMSQGTQPGVQLVLPGVDEKVARQEVRDWLKQFGGKVGSRRGEYYADNAMVPQISDHPVDIYATVQGRKDETVVTMFVNLGGTFLDPKEHKAQFSTFQSMADELGTRLMKAQLEADIREVEKEIRSTERELSHLQREQKRLEEAIEDCERTIKESQERLKENAQSQKETQARLEELNKQLEQLQKRLKDL